jgi:hypothetical protein
MKNSYKEVIKLLQKKEPAPNQLFNRIMFSIQNNQQQVIVKKKNPYIILTPILTSIVVLFIFFGANKLDVSQQVGFEDDLLVQAYTQSYYDSFFININQDFLY